MLPNYTKKHSDWLSFVNDCHPFWYSVWTDKLLIAGILLCHG